MSLISYQNKFLDIFNTCYNFTKPNGVVVKYWFTLSTHDRKKYGTILVKCTFLHNNNIFLFNKCLVKLCLKKVQKSKKNKNFLLKICTRQIMAFYKTHDRRKYGTHSFVNFWLFHNPNIEDSSTIEIVSSPLFYLHLKTKTLNGY